MLSNGFYSILRIILLFHFILSCKRNIHFDLDLALMYHLGVCLSLSHFCPPSPGASSDVASVQTSRTPTRPHPGHLIDRNIELLYSYFQY